MTLRWEEEAEKECCLLDFILNAPTLRLAYNNFIDKDWKYMYYSVHTGRITASGQFIPGLSKLNTSLETQASMPVRTKRPAFKTFLLQRELSGKPYNVIPSFKPLWGVKNSICHYFTWVKLSCSRKGDLGCWFCTSKWRLSKWENTEVSYLNL